MSDYELKEVFDINKFTVVGTPTLTDDGIASGFSDSNYLTKSLSIAENANFSFILPVKITDTTNNLQGIYNVEGSNVIFQIRKEGTGIFVSGFDSVVGNFAFSIPNFVKNQKYFIRVIKNGNSLTLGYSTKLRNWSDSSFDLTGHTIPAITTFNIGVANPSWNSISGDLDLNNIQVYVDGVEVFKGTKTVIAKIPPARVEGGKLEVKSVYNPDAFTIVGSPTITDDGIASGFSANNYIGISSSFLSADTWKIKCPISHTQTVLAGLIVSVQVACFQVNYSPSNKRFYYSFSSNNSSWDIGNSNFVATNLDITKDATFVLEFTGTAYKLDVIQNGISVGSVTITSSTKLYQTTNNIIFGQARGLNAPTDGTVDLKQIEVWADGEEVFSGSKLAEVHVPLVPMDYNKALKELQDYYANLLIIQYHNKPKAIALIKNLVKYLYADMILFKIRDGFNIVNQPYAIGKQLDCIGEWVGIDRIYDAGQPAYPWFSYVDWNQTTTDADQGGFQDWDDPIAQDGGFIGWDDLVAGKNKTTLADDLFFALIKLKIIKNVSTHTMDDLATRLYQYFGNGIYTTLGKYVYNSDVFTVVGSPTITADGMASGFGNSAYVKITGLSFGSNPWEITDKFTFSSSGSNQALISGVTNASAPLLYISATGMQLHIPSSVGAWGWQLTNASHTFTVGNTYYYKAGWTGTNYYIKVSDDLGSTWTTLQTLAGTAMLGGSGNFDLAIGSNPAQSSRYVNGSIDLKQFSIKVDGQEIFSGQRYDGRYLTYNYTQDYKTIMEVAKVKNAVPIPTGMVVSYNLV